MCDKYYYSNSYSTSKRRHTYPSTSFVDPAIVRFIERASSASSIRDIMDDDEEEMDDDNDDQQTTITSISLPQQLHYHKTSSSSTASHTTSHNLDQPWTKQDRYDNLELRLLSLEVTKKRFEHRLQALESGANNQSIILQQQQPMKPDQQPITTTRQTTRQTLQGNMIHHHHHDNRLSESQTHDYNEEEMMVTSSQKYMDLLSKHESLMSKYNLIQIEFQEKEKYYKQRIQELVDINKKKEEEERTIKLTRSDYNQLQVEEDEEEASYKEEDGYLIFDTTNMNGEIIHCKVKIPTPTTTAATTMGLASPPATRMNSPQYQSPLTPLPSSINNNVQKKKKGLNYNAPEWKSNRS